jgi:hypothetical protein
VIDVERSNDGWVTLQDASVITGKSITSLRMMIKRRKIDQVKKISGKRGDKWVIKKEALSLMSDQDPDFVNGEQKHRSNADSMIRLPVEVYTQQQKERDQLVQGLAMYRYKFEELEKQVKMLPAPVEVVSSRMPELETRVKELEAALEAENKRSWWKRFLGLK